MSAFEIVCSSGDREAWLAARTTGIGASDMPPGAIEASQMAVDAMVRSTEMQRALLEVAAQPRLV